MHKPRELVLLDRADVFFIEALDVANLSRRNLPKRGQGGMYLPNGQAIQSGLNKSFADAGIAEFLSEILPYKAEKAGNTNLSSGCTLTKEHDSHIEGVLEIAI